MQERARLAEALAGVPVPREVAAEQARMRQDIDALKRRAQFLEVEVQQCRDRLSQAAAQVRRVC